MLDREPCKSDEWLSEMENRDVSAPQLVDMHVPERKWLARERRVKIGTRDMLRARVKLQKLSSCRNCGNSGRHRHFGCGPWPTQGEARVVRMMLAWRAATRYDCEFEGEK
jgi:hypothetical protein